jgi:hypothetical protein
MAQYDAEQAKQIANTIASQLGGLSRLVTMIGAKHFGFDRDGSLSFSFMKTDNKINWVKIVLDPSDTYTVTFGWKWGAKFTEKGSHEGIYCDMLATLFQNTTGLTLTMPRVRMGGVS